MIRILGVLWFVTRFIITGRKRKSKWNWFPIYVQPADSKKSNRYCPKCGQHEPVLKPSTSRMGRDIEIRYNKRQDMLEAGCHRCKAKWFERTEDWKNRSY